MVLVRSDVRELYGGEKSTIATAAGLVERGWRTRFLTTSEDDLVGELDAAGLEHEVIAVGDPFTGFRDAPLRDKARRLLGIARVNAAVYRRVRGGARVVHTIAIPGFICGWLGGRLGGVPVIYHVRSASMNRRTRGLEEVAMLLASRTVAVSRSLRDQLLDTGRRYVKPFIQGRVLAIYNGFDFVEIDATLARESRAAARVALGVPADRPTALHVGGIFRDKGQLAVIEGMLPAVVAEVPDFHLTFVGGVKDADYERRCREAVVRLGLSRNVTFAGYLSKSGVYRWYRAADFLVLPSEREGLPRCAVEAQAFGLPVVATAIVGSVEAVRDGETGQLVPLDRLDDMARACVRLATDESLRRRLGRAAAAHVRASFGLERNVRAFESLYRDILGG